MQDCYGYNGARYVNSVFVRVTKAVPSLDSSCEDKMSKVIWIFSSNSWKIEHTAPSLACFSNKIWHIMYIMYVIICKWLQM